MGMSDFRISGEDKLKRTFILPKKVLWAGDGVTNSERLLNPEFTQVYVGKPKGTRLSNEDGKKGAVLIDFGSELAGGLEVLVCEGVSNPSGVKLRICFGESVSEAMSNISEKNATNDHAVRDMSVLLTPWSQQSFANTGYRFVYFELEEENSWVEFLAVRGIFTYRDIPYWGSFECDDALFNQIYDVCAYTVHLNMQNMLWDGIKRDRLVWIGDMYPEMLTIRSVFGDSDVIDECMKFAAESNGVPRWTNNITTYALWYLLILWNWYWYNGRTELIWEQKDYWKALLEQLLALVHPEEEELFIEKEFRLGFFFDWPTNETEEAKAGVYALFRLALLAAAKLCAMTNEAELEAQCLEFARLLNKKNMKHNDRKQVVAMLKLADMIDRKEAGQILSKDGGRGMSTFMSYFILMATADTAGMDSAQEMLREYYGAMLEAGATTFWEDFDLEWMREGARIDCLLKPGEYDIHGDNGRFCYQGLRHSLCHGWSAGPAAFLAERVLGIRILEPGCKKIEIKPELGKLKWARGTYPTPYGVVRVDARREGDKVVTEIDVPKKIICLR